MENNLRKSLVTQITTRIQDKALGTSDSTAKDEILSELEMFEQISFSKHEEIEIGSVVKLETNNTLAQYFLTPAMSGEILEFQSAKILTVSIFSALGMHLMGKSVGDRFSINTKSFEIKEIW